MSTIPLACLDPQRSDRDGVMVSIQFQPMGVTLNGWNSRGSYVAYIFEDNEWNPILAPVPDGSGRYAVIGGMSWFDEDMIALANGKMTQAIPRSRAWTFSHQSPSEMCELMRVYFQRRILQAASVRPGLLPSYADNRLANLDYAAFMNEASRYHEAVYAFWKQFEA